MCEKAEPGRPERSPAQAPLRTVRESFPSHGSSLSMDNSRSRMSRLGKLATKSEPDLYTGGAPFASDHVRESEPDRLPFLAQALISLVWLVLGDDACECSINLTIPSDSSVAPD